MNKNQWPQLKNFRIRSDWRASEFKENGEPPIPVTPTAIDQLAKTSIRDWLLVASSPQQPSGQKHHAQQHVEDVIILPKLKRPRQQFP